MGRFTNRPGYKWAVTAAAFMMVFVCLGFCSSNKGLYLAAITNALNIKRSLFSINDSVRFITTAVVNLFFGVLIGKLGVRKMVSAGFVSLIISVLIYAHAKSIFLFYIGGAFLGMGLAWTTTTMVGYIVNSWCREHKGKIMGFVLAGNGFGGALAAQIVTPIIYEEGNAFGYQNAYRLVGLILMVVGAAVVFVIRDAPVGVSAEVPKKQARGNTWSGITFQEAVHKPYFYTAAICVFLTGSALQGVNGISSAHMTDVGIDAGFMAAVISAHSLALAGAKFFAGAAYDRFGLKKTMLFCYGAAICAYLALALSSNSTAGMICSMVYGVVSSMALPMETIMLPLIAGDVFGQKDFAKLLGILVSISTAGFAVTAPITNIVFDLYGTYKPILIAFAVLMCIVATIFLLTLRLAARDRKERVK